MRAGPHRRAGAGASEAEGDDGHVGMPIWAPKMGKSSRVPDHALRRIDRGRAQHGVSANGLHGFERFNVQNSRTGSLSLAQERVMSGFLPGEAVWIAVVRGGGIHAKARQNILGHRHF